MFVRIVFGRWREGVCASTRASAAAATRPVAEWMKSRRFMNPVVGRRSYQGATSQRITDESVVLRRIVHRCIKTTRACVWRDRMNILLWVLQVVLALAFFAHGSLFLFPPAAMVDQLNAALP